MRGTYRFYQDGKLVAEQDNLITTGGKTAILRYLAGHTGAIARSLVVGTGTTAANVADTKLNFEVDRAAVNVISPDYVNQKVIFKATLPQGSNYAIWEIGAITGSIDEAIGQAIFSFDSVSEPWSVGAFQTDANRIGGDALRVNAAVSTTVTSALVDIFMQTEQYGDSDKFSLAYAPVDANLASLKIRFKTDASNYFEYTIPTLTAGYKVVSWAKSVMTKVGSPSWDSIVSAELVVQANGTGATNVDFDGLRIDPAVYSGTENVLVSRTVLGTPVVKTDVSQMDVEYTLDVTI